MRTESAVTHETPEIAIIAEIHHYSARFFANWSKLLCDYSFGMKIVWLAAACAIPLSLGAPAPSTVDALFAPLIHPDEPGLAVMIRQNGRTVFERGYGLADLRTGRKIGPTTDFRLASLTKQFTAMAVMLLVHDGKLRYDEKLTEIFPDFPAYGRSITIRSLLTHTSGLPDYENLMGPQWSAAHQIDDQEVLQLLDQQSAGKFAPGTSWDYSNSGYVMLGLIAAKISGVPFPQFLHDRIFQPLHMSSTLAYVQGRNEIPNRAYGYSRNETGEFVPSDQSATSATLGDGGVYTNLRDLAKWDDALRKNTLLSAKEMSAAFAPVRLANGASPSWPMQPGDDNLAPGQPVAYGFGWFVDPYKGHPREWHFGTTSGFRTAIERFPADGLTIVILANRTDLDPPNLALRIVAIAMKNR